MTSSWLWPFSSSAASRRSEAGGKKRKGGWENKGGERKRGKSGVLAQMCEIKVGYYGPGRNTPQRPRSRPGTTGENGNFSWLLLTLQRQVKKKQKKTTHTQNKTEMLLHCEILRHILVAKRTCCLLSTSAESREDGVCTAGDGKIWGQGVHEPVDTLSVWVFETNTFKQINGS